MPTSKNKRRSGKKAFQRKEMDRSLRARVKKHIPEAYVEEEPPKPELTAAEKVEAAWSEICKLVAGASVTPEVYFEMTFGRSIHQCRANPELINKAGGILGGKNIDSLTEHPKA